MLSGRIWVIAIVLALTGLGAGFVLRSAQVPVEAVRHSTPTAAPQSSATDVAPAPLPETRTEMTTREQLIEGEVSPEISQESMIATNSLKWRREETSRDSDVEDPVAALDSTVARAKNRARRLASLGQLDDQKTTQLLVLAETYQRERFAMMRSEDRSTLEVVELQQAYRQQVRSLLEGSAIDAEIRRLADRFERLQAAVKANEQAKK